MPILNEVQVQQCKDEQVKLLKEKLKIEKIIGFYKIKEVMEHAKRAGYNIKNSDPEYQPFQNKHIQKQNCTLNKNQIKTITIKVIKVKYSGIIYKYEKVYKNDK